MTDQQCMAAVIRGVQARGGSVWDINRARVLRRKEDSDTIEQIVDGEMRLTAWKRQARS